MPRGGKREGAGKPTGTKNRETLQKEAVYAEVRQRIMRNANKLINAQLTKAFGSVQIFQVIKKGEKFEHELVTDPALIKEVLDEGHGMNCTTERGLFIVTEIQPETKAIDSMLDRTFGKAQQSIEIRRESDNWRTAIEQLIANGRVKDIQEAVALLKQDYALTPEIESEILSNAVH